MPNYSTPIIVIGASTGGPQILEKIITSLPKDIIMPIIVIQHMPKYFTEEFAERLNRISAVTVCEAHDNQSLQKGVVYIAAGGHHLVMNSREKLFLSNFAPIKTFKPSIDMTMKSIAEYYSGKIISIILSGMGDDGLEGVKAIKAVDGHVIAQDPLTCLIDSMPRKIIEASLADEILTPDQIIKRIIQLSK